MHSFLKQFEIQMAHPGHAYLLLDISPSEKKDIFSFFKKNWRVDTENNPDFYYLNNERLKIDQVRSISNMQAMGRMSESTRRIIFIEFGSITTEAQNAFLKSIEEPSPGTILFLVTQSSVNLLPTIYSRVITIKGERKNNPNQLVNEFLSSDFKNRQALISNHFLADSKKNKTTDRVGAKAFCADLEFALYAQKENINNFAELYKDLAKVNQYVGDSSSNIKYIFDYLALRVPMLR